MSENSKKIILTLGLATLWITISEFLRNEFLFKSYWINHFESLGLTFETLSINGILWLIWSFGLAFLILKLLEKFSFKETIFLSWISAFLMMWITTYNLQVLPVGLLIFAIPLSLFEVYVAGKIIRYFKKGK
jgi:hypothetical protein